MAEQRAVILGAAGFIGSHLCDRFIAEGWRVTGVDSLITGTLLVFALLVIPAATAQNITPRPGLSALIAVTLAVLVTWASLFIAYFSPYPIGFYLTSLAFASYVVTAGFQARPRRPRMPQLRRNRPRQAIRTETTAATRTAATQTAAITP